MLRSKFRVQGSSINFQQKRPKSHFWPIVTKFEISSKHKICSKCVLNTVGASFESLNFIVFEKENFEKIFSLFCAFLEPKRYLLIFDFSHIGQYRFGSKKVQKSKKNFRNFLFRKLWSLSFQKTPLPYLKTHLEQILCFDEVWSQSAKSAIFAVFAEN